MAKAEKFEIKVEKGVPVPTERTSGAQYVRDILRAMEVGDSFHVEAAWLGRVRHSIRTLGLPGRKYVSRQVDEGGYRFWRSE